MRNTFFKVFVLFFLGSLIISGCDKEVVRPNPTLTFYSGIGYTDRDTTAASGSSISIGLDCKWNGVDRLNAITIYLNNEYPRAYEIPDSVKQEGILKIDLFKTSLDQDTWLFEISDVNGQRAYLGLVVKKDKSGGEIVEYKGIKLGAQNNTVTGSFYAFGNSTTYNLANATTNQTIIDLVLGYDADNKLYLASPSADLTNEFDLSTWTTKNTVWYCKSKKTAGQYGFIDSDIVLVSEFSESSKNEKAKDLKAGDVYSVKLFNGKYGLFKVNSIITGADGQINFDIKIQK